MSSSYRILSCLFSVVLLSACQVKQPEPEPEPIVIEESVDYTHVVRFSGETLGIIAAWYTGSSKNWQEIADANPGLQPERINLGQEIIVPAALLVRDTALDEDYVRRFYSGGSNSAAESTEPTPAETAETAEADDNAAAPESEDSADPFALTEPTDSDADTDDASAAQDEVVAEPVDDGAADTAASDEEAEALLDELTADMNTSEEGTSEADAPAADDSVDEAERERLLDELLGE